MLVSVMVKPVSCACNMACEYCFYNSLVKERENADYGKMSYDTLKNIIKKGLELASGDDFYLSFQGGEPLLAGLEFFNTAEKYLKTFNLKNSNIIFAVQTNGVLINQEWCDFFKRNNCLVGVSLDGDRQANTLRVDKSGGITFDRVLDNIRLLNYNKIEFNVLTVVTKYVAQNINRIYNFFKGENFKYLQFTPCLKPYGKQSLVGDIYMSGQEYGDFLIELTKLYFDDYMKGNYVSVRQLDGFVHLAAGKRAFQCGMNGTCSLQFVVEADGSVYPCDFFALDDYLLGNVNDMNFLELALSKVEKKFLAKSLEINEKCKKCQYWALCKNGCMRERTDVDKCTAYKMYFSKMLPYLQFLSQGIADN